MFRIASEDKMKTSQTKLMTAIALVIRWSVVGIFTLIIALPTIVSVTTPA